MARSLTIENFIQSYYERYGKNRLIPPVEVQGMMAHLFAYIERSHFDYVSADGEAMEQITSFLIKVKCNNVSLESFGFAPQKEAELETLLERVALRGTIVHKALELFWDQLMRRMPLRLYLRKKRSKIGNFIRDCPPCS